MWAPRFARRLNSGASRCGLLARAPRCDERNVAREWVQWDMGSGDDLPGGVFDGVSAVIHCAGLAHRHADERDYQRLNVEATSDLARRAVDAGVSHFIYVSSLNVVPIDAPSAGDPADISTPSQRSVMRRPSGAPSRVWVRCFRESLPVDGVTPGACV